MPRSFIKITVVEDLAKADKMHQGQFKQKSVGVIKPDTSGKQLLVSRLHGDGSESFEIVDLGDDLATAKMEAKNKGVIVLKLKQ